jgi:DNA gyrase subunit A
MRLRRLTGLEREKIEQELADLLKEIEELKAILASEQKVLEIIKKEMLEIKDKYADERRTHIDMTAVDYIEDESLIPVENILIALTNKGYIKRVANDTFKAQHRGGVGIKGMSTNEEDFPEKLVSMKTHDYILMFSNLGKVYRMKGYEIPEYSRQSKGLPIINLLPIEKDEKITSIVAISDDNDKAFLTFVTKKGLIKRTAKEEFDNIRSNGKKAIILKEDDELIAVKKTDGTKEIVIGASNGKVVRFNETEVRVMGRGSSGVKGIELEENDIVVGAEVVENGAEILIVTVNGYGKKTPIEEYRLTHRGSKGVKTLNVTEKNGSLISLRSVYEDEDLIIITDNGMTIKMNISQISTLSRNTQGVRLINLKDGQKVSTTAIVEKDEETEEIESNENQLDENNEEIGTKEEKN